MKELLCHDRTCKNKGNQCWVTATNQHVPLNSAQVFGWSAAIDQNDGTVIASKNIIETAQSTASKNKKTAAKAMTELSSTSETSASSSGFDRLIDSMALGD